MSAEFLENCMKKAIEMLPTNDFIEPELQRKYNLWSNSYAIRKLHFPDKNRTVTLVP